MDRKRQEQAGLFLEKEGRQRGSEIHSVALINWLDGFLIKGKSKLRKFSFEPSVPLWKG
jgi:hypothetical protein